MKNKYIINISDMGRVSNDFMFRMLIDGKLSTIQHNINKKKIDGIYTELNNNLSLDQQKSLCELLKQKFNIKYKLI